MTLSERLKTARMRAGLKQSEVARLSGMAQPSYQALESGKAKTTTRLIELSRALGVSSVWLQTGADAVDIYISNSGEPIPVAKSFTLDVDALTAAIDEANRAAALFGITPTSRQLAESINRAYADILSTRLASGVSKVK